MPLLQKSWGEEDIALTAALTQSGVEVYRPCVPLLWHTFHPKFTWGSSLDGMRRGMKPLRNDTEARRAAAETPLR